MRYCLHILVLGFLFCCVQTVAQNDSELRQVLIEAEGDYRIGRFEQMQELLHAHLSSFKGYLKQNAYRLLALCYLATDDDVEAEKNAILLLNENPYYSSVQDPIRFQDMVNRLKAGRSATITTASKLAESVEEAPVPVTLITEDMIRMSTARNLLELLEDYVPGVNIVEGEESNFAMRGIFSYSQEDVLIMLNGVRLNSYCTNSIAPDFRISLANIKQIEVLRGAASSLYGNVALSAVVNIITKTGSDVNGLQATAGMGNTHTLKADLVVGKHLVDFDIMTWGSIYNSRGTRHFVDGDDPNARIYGEVPRSGTLYVNGFNHKPSFDLGLKLRWKNLDLQVSHKYGKRNYTYNNIFLTSIYSYDKYEPIDGMKPGRGVASTNGSLRYSTTWGKWTLDAGVNANLESANLYNVLGDSINENTAYLLTLVEWDDDEYVNKFLSSAMPTGVFQTQSWKNWNLSADVKAIYEYALPKLGHGSLLFGMQYDYFNVYYNDFSLGDNYNRIAVTTVNKRAKTFLNNDEHSQSFFVQLKHQLNRQLILNAGLRSDYRKRYSKENIRQLSPRMALIWSPTRLMNYKLSYARSFVDAPYFYRASSIVYIGTNDIRPQYMDNYQLSAILNAPRQHLKFESCLFYNHTKDIVKLAMDAYRNIATVKNLGWENTVEYENKGFKARATTYLQHVINQEGVNEEYDPGKGDRIYSIPDFTAHLQLQKTFPFGLTAIAKGSYCSKQTFFYETTYVIKLIHNGYEYMYQEKETLPSCFLMDLGLRYNWRNLELSVNCNNVFDHSYLLGGDRVPIPQEGRILLGTLKINLE